MYIGCDPGLPGVQAASEGADGDWNKKISEAIARALAQSKNEDAMGKFLAIARAMIEVGDYPESGTSMEQLSKDQDAL